MHGINGRPVIDLDPHIDIEGFNALIDECRVGIAKSQWELGSFGPGVYEKDLTRDLSAIENGAYGLGGRPPHPDSEHLQAVFLGLSTHQRRLYLKLRYGLFSAGSSVYLRTPINNNYMAIHKEEGNEWTANAAHFPTLCRWIRALPLQAVGRVLFFINEHNCRVVEHSDMHYSSESKAYVANHPHKQEFVWIRPSVQHAKGFYVLDEQTQERHYVKGQSAWFNSFDVHGADAGPTMTWSLRVDGVFKPEFRQALLEQQDATA